MKSAWILPDRHQTGTLLLDEGGRLEPLHKVIDLRKLPRSLTLGIPEELFAANRSGSTPFFQLARLGDDETLFTASLEAGADDDGRAVVLTLLFKLDQGKAFDLKCLAEIDVPVSEVAYAKTLLGEINTQLCNPSSQLATMLNAVERLPTLLTFASETLIRSANRPDWMKKKAFGREFAIGYARSNSKTNKPDDPAFKQLS